MNRGIRGGPGSRPFLCLYTECRDGAALDTLTRAVLPSHGLKRDHTGRPPSLVPSVSRACEEGIPARIVSLVFFTSVVERLIFLIVIPASRAPTARCGR